MSDEPELPSRETPEQKAALQPRRTFSVSELLVLEKSRSWLNELLSLTSPAGFHRNRPKRESLRASIRAILKTLSEFEA